MLGPLAALATSLTWTLGSWVYTQLARDYHPAAINFNRAIVGSTLFGLVILLQWQDYSLLFQQMPLGWETNFFWLLGSILSSYAVGDVFFIWSALALGFPAAQAIGSLYPLWAAFSGILISSQWPGVREWQGVLLCVGGILLVVLSGRKSLLVPRPRFGFGLICAFLTSFCWAFNGVAIHKGGHGLPIPLANFIRLSLALVICPLVAFIQQRKKVTLLFTWKEYKKFWPVMAIEAFLGSFFYVYGMTNSSLSVGSTLTSLSPIFALPLAIYWGQEKFSYSKGFGVIMVVVGGVVLTLA
jgi:drug/metabolite transporter (DMT)-like permease